MDFSFTYNHDFGVANNNISFIFFFYIPVIVFFSSLITQSILTIYAILCIIVGSGNSYRSYVNQIYHRKIVDSSYH